MTDRTALISLWVASALFALAFLRVETGIGVDSTQTVAWVNSLAWDRDLDFTNDHLHTSNDPWFLLAWQRLHLDTATGGPLIGPTGHWANTAPVGPAVAWDVGLAPVMLTEFAVHGAEEFGEFDRFSLRYRLIVSLVSFALGIHALFVLYHTARRFFPPGVSAAGALAAVFGSMASYYILLEGAMTHATALWSAALVWALAADRWQRRPERWGAKDLALGMAVGMLAMTRQSAIVWALIPAGVYLSQMVRPPTRRGAVLGAVIATGGSLLVYAIQMAAWRAVFGEWITIPQGGGFLHSAGRGLALWETLFGRFNALFPSHPWTLLALAGFALWGWRRPAIALPALLALALTWLINASVADWYAGASFGARRWSHTMPLFALGWAAVMSALPRRWPRRIAGGALLAALLIWNMLMMTQHVRDLLTPAWWVQRDVWPMLLGAAADQPFDWMPGTLVDLLEMGMLHLRLAVWFLLGLTVAFAAVALLTAGGRRPWPRGRWGRIALGLAALHAAIWIGFCLAARMDAADREGNLRLRALLAERDPTAQWVMIERGEFAPARPLDHATVAGLTFDHGDQEAALAHLASSETEFPRFARVLTLQRAASPEPRRRAALHLWADLRPFDFHAMEALFEHHAGEGEIHRLVQMVEGIPMTRDQRSSMALRLAHLRSDRGDLRRALRERLETHPTQSGLRMQLMHIERERERESRAARLHSEAQAWAESALRGHEAIARSHPEESAALFSGAIHQTAATLLQTIDVAHETERALAVLDRHSAIQRDPALVDAFGEEMHRRLREAAPRTLGTTRDPRLVRAIEQWSAERLDDPRAHESLIEVWGARGEWQEAMERLAIAVERTPGEIDALMLAYTAASALSAEEVASAEIESLTEEAQPIAAIGLSLRALGVGDEALAARWAARAREEEIPEALRGPLRERVWALYGDQP